MRSFPGNNSDRHYLLKSILSFSLVLLIACSPLKIYRDLPEVKAWETCEKHENTYFIKTDFAFLTKTGIPDDNLFIADKLHLNSKGYQAWTEIIRRELDKVLTVEEPNGTAAQRHNGTMAPELDGIII